MWNGTISTTAGMNRSPQSFVPNSVINGSPPVGASSRKGNYYSNNFNLERIEASLGRARAAIRAAAASSSSHGSNQMQRQRQQQQDHPHLDNYLPKGPMYRKATAFLRSYLEMEKQLKVFIYEEGEPPVFHYGPCKHAYAIEGLFIQSMEVSQFRTWDPEEAHVFFLPFSVTMITQVVYVVNSHDWSSMKNTAMDYVNLIAAKYPYWNRSLGADHFILACHDWAPEISFAVPNLYNNSIRALCNANTSEQFNPARDVSIPEIHLPTGTTEGILGGPPPSRRPVLVFYAGGIHGPIRPVLLEHWENKDPDVQVHQYLPENVSYYGMMRKSKYCICPSGYEVASPRMVEGLYMGCVPVLIKDHYVIPFSDVLNWETFSVIVAVEDIPNLKRILMGISSTQYLKMQRRGLQMRRHFEVNSPPKRERRTEHLTSVILIEKGVGMEKLRWSLIISAGAKIRRHCKPLQVGRRHFRARQGGRHWRPDGHGLCVEWKEGRDKAQGISGSGG
ncbi:probable glycosyltransferase At5g03795 isoform X2 [Diospyros lotus]|nr:probable glycosyltransferase At5g03795 isoform X2 [Diospyros lotus]XP_052175020.1 probable glycosyltransferase At5g03795 isoform X2 [Diospyros lotus]